MNHKIFIFLFSFLLLGVLNVPPAARAATEAFKKNPNYEAVYPDNRISILKLIIKSDDWAAMQANMRKIYGEPGKPPTRPPQDGAHEKPMWVQGQIELNGVRKANVAIRYKGNSSLILPWIKGSHRLPFKIDFAKYEKGGAFYGFEEMSLSNNFADDTYLREPLAYRLLGELGLPASRTALYRIFVNHGEGDNDYGIYTAIEVTNDTVVGQFFGEDHGNIYEGDGRGATLAKATTVEQIKSAYQKENNKKKADWNDVIGLYHVLHSPKRLTEPTVWRRDLEQIFEVRDFLKWLAISSTLEHWDTYGAIPHNFFLYNKNGKLHWISWDHNLILGAKLGFPARINANDEKPPGPPFFTVSFDRGEITDKWPLIRFLLDDSVFNQQYQEWLSEMRNRYFNALRIESDLRNRAAMIRTALPSKEAGSFDASVEALIKKLHEREQKLSDYLKTL